MAQRYTVTEPGFKLRPAWSRRGIGYRGSPCNYHVSTPTAGRLGDFSAGLRPVPQLTGASPGPGCFPGICLWDQEPSQIWL